tara:strand:- start:542 stop:1207 length:666 start_codon:yes stop_codon:yes gene_type:complete
MNKLNHIAFIMDGNGRWGQKKNKGRNYGHLKGVETVKKIVRTSIKLKIPFITFFVFSSENWKRPKTEIKFLFKLIKNYFHKEIHNVINQGIKINIIGEKDKLPLDLKKTLTKCENLTQKNKNINVNLAINYGAKNEILMAASKSKKINFKNLEKNLYTKNMPDPDILVRTGGNQRLSNFMLWQLAYTELFFLKKLWPDFKSTDLINIIKVFKKIKRNYGAL